MQCVGPMQTEKLTSSGSPSFSAAYHTCSKGRINKEGFLPGRIPGQQTCSTSWVSGWKLGIRIIPQYMEVIFFGSYLILHYASRKHFYISLIKCFLKNLPFFTYLPIVILAVAFSVLQFAALGCISSRWFSLESKAVFIWKVIYILLTSDDVKILLPWTRDGSFRHNGRPVVNIHVRTSPKMAVISRTIHSLSRNWSCWIRGISILLWNNCAFA